MLRKIHCTIHQPRNIHMSHIKEYIKTGLNAAHLEGHVRRHAKSFFLCNFKSAIHSRQNFRAFLNWLILITLLFTEKLLSHAWWEFECAENATIEYSCRSWRCTNPNYSSLINVACICFLALITTPVKLPCQSLQRSHTVIVQKIWYNVNELWKHYL